MPTPIYQVDAFISGKKFSGNPAAVCPLDRPADPAWMQNIAMEMNLAETAFLDPAGDGYNLRWFTPELEEDLCGHATLASAHVLWETGMLDHSRQARFHSRSGLLTAVRRGDLIELDFPATPPAPVAPPDGLLGALAVQANYVGKSRFDYLVEVESRDIVESLSPDLSLLAKVSTRGVIVTALSPDSEYDFVSRFFAPGEGISEDPVTGSAHCALGPYWMGRLKKKEFMAYQASRRGGVLHVRVDGERVKLGGRAELVLKGELIL